MVALSRRWDIPLLMVLSIFWASSFTAIKIAVGHTSPISIVLIRCTIGAMVMGVFVVLMARRSVWPRGWRQWLNLVFAGIMSTALPFYLISFAEQKITSSMTAILMTAGPMVAILLGHFFTDDEKINRGKILGIGIGFLATIYLLRAGLEQFGSSDLIYLLAAVVAASCYAVGGLAAKKLPQVSAEVIALMVLLISSLVAVPFVVPSVVSSGGSVILETPLEVWLALAWLGVVPSGIAFYLRYALIKRNGYGFVSYVGYLIPLFSILMGVVILREQIGLDSLAAMGVILMGLILTRDGDDFPWSLRPALGRFRHWLK